MVGQACINATVKGRPFFEKCYARKVRYTRGSVWLMRVCVSRRDGERPSVVVTGVLWVYSLTKELMHILRRGRHASGRLPSCTGATKMRYIGRTEST